VLAIDRALVVRNLRYDPFGNAAVSAAVILRGPQVAFTTGCYAGSPLGRDARLTSASDYPEAET